MILIRLFVCVRVVYVQNGNETLHIVYIPNICVRGRESNVDSAPIKAL